MGGHLSQDGREIQSLVKVQLRIIKRSINGKGMPSMDDDELEEVWELEDLGIL